MWQVDAARAGQCQRGVPRTIVALRDHEPSQTVVRRVNAPPDTEVVLFDVDAHDTAGLEIQIDIGICEALSRLGVRQTECRRLAQSRGDRYGVPPQRAAVVDKRTGQLRVSFTQPCVLDRDNTERRSNESLHLGVRHTPFNRQQAVSSDLLGDVGGNRAGADEDGATDQRKKCSAHALNSNAVSGGGIALGYRSSSESRDVARCLRRSSGEDANPASLPREGLSSNHDLKS
jgi:hypothetical protein